MGLTEAQKKMRLTGISASEIAGLFGMSSHMNPSKIFRIKCEGYEEPDSPYTLRGRMLEPSCLEWYRVLTGKTLTYPGTVRHPDRPILLATPDAVADGHIAVEVKTVGSQAAHLWGKPGTDQIPEKYLLQIQYQLGVLGLQEAHVPALLPGLELEIFRVAFDVSLFEMLAGAAERFWVEHVAPRKPPRGYRALKAKEEQAHGGAGNGVDAVENRPHQEDHLPQGHRG